MIEEFMKKSILLLLLFGPSLVFADRIITKEGIVYEGTVIRTSNDVVEYKTSEVPFLQIKTERIYKIEYSDGSVDTFSKSPEIEEAESQFSENHSHSGFFFRGTFGLMVGATSLRAHEMVPDSSSDLGGIGAHLRLAYGWAFIENLPMYGFAGFYGHTKLNININLFGPANQVLRKAETYSFRQFGIGISPYFSPMNFYLSFSGGISQVKVGVIVDSFDSFGLGTSLPTEEYASEWGPALHLAIGYEWWASENWGLGMNLFVDYSTHKINEGRLNLFVLGVSFSATYN